MVVRHYYYDNINIIICLYVNRYIILSQLVDNNITILL